MSAGEVLLAKIQTQAEQDPGTPPVVMLDGYFNGNTDEECIAPNQVGCGRPPLVDFYARLRQIQARPNVQAVLVGFHGDWGNALKHPDDWPAAENIHIYTTASAAEVAAWISGLASDERAPRGGGGPWRLSKRLSGRRGRCLTLHMTVAC